MDFLLLIIAIVFVLYAQSKVQGTFNKYLTYPVSTHFSGKDVAKTILSHYGLFDIKIEEVKDALSDHYNPQNKTLYLSSPVFNASTISSVGVAAHEAGHALQHKENYGPLALRTHLVPVANIGSSLAIPLFFLGLIFRISGLLTLGIIFFFGALIFQLITLPVEYNASNKAKEALTNLGIVNSDEALKVQEVLNAAALTYVASLVLSLAWFLRLLMLSSRRR